MVTHKNIFFSYWIDLTQMARVSHERKKLCLCIHGELCEFLYLFPQACLRWLFFSFWQMKKYLDINIDSMLKFLLRTFKFLCWVIVQSTRSIHRIYKYLQTVVIGSLQKICAPWRTTNYSLCAILYFCLNFIRLFLLYNFQ